MLRARVLFVSIAIASACLASQALSAPTPENDPAVTAMIESFNSKLAARGLHVAVEQVEFFTIGRGRPANRIHQQPFQWVANDARRNADGTNITYLVDQSDGATASGLTNAQTEAAIDRALGTWQSDQALRKVRLVKRADSGVDPDIVDFFAGSGDFGTTFLADIVEAGFLPRSFFDAIGGPGAGSFILAVTFTFIFTDDFNQATDINNDRHLDTALAEVYYNDAFGAPGDRAAFPWGVNVALPGIDVETVALHENGHALSLGHFGPPPSAVMNPIYDGVSQTLKATDHAGMSSVWNSWPR